MSHIPVFPITMRSILKFVLLFFLTLQASAQYTIRDPDAIPLHGKWQFAMAKI